MNRLKSAVLLFVTLTITVLLLTLPAGGFAQTEQPAGNPTDTLLPNLPPDSADMPLLEDGAPNQFPIISYQPERADSTTAPAALSIELPYGTTQSFGQLGLPQEVANIIGIVVDATPSTTLTYRLNGGPEEPLSLGPDQRRLYEPGSFNIEIPFASLTPGANTVAIKAVDGGDQVTQNVTVNFTQGAAWPTNYAIDWSAAPSILGVSQAVTGDFEIVGGELRTTIPGYDRLLAIGDLGWTDYEVTVPVTVESLNDQEWGPPSNGAGVGFITGWQGHYPMASEQPNLGWRRALNSLSWYTWNPNGTSGFRMLGFGGGKTLASSDEQMALNTTYIFKMSVQSSSVEGFPNTYRFKYWPQGSPEPALWTMQGDGLAGEPRTGSLLLVAHQAMVRFGDVTVRPIAGIPNSSITVQPSNNGTIILEPNKPSYAYGERVSVRALGDPGYSLSSWTGDLSGNQNPLVFDVTQDVTVKANFQPAPDPTLTVTVDGNGSVTVAPDKAQYQYGETVQLIPVPKAGFLFAGWNGDLTGVNNPGTIVMNGDRTVSARFEPANAASPISDDFNSCELDASLWNFQNPVGDGTVGVNGTQLVLTAPAGLPHDIWLGGNRSVRVMQPTDDANFEIVAKFDSLVTKRFQMQGILVEQDNNNFLRLEVHHDGSSVEVYAAKFVNGSPEPIIKTPLPNTPPWLRVTRTADNWGFSYSFDGAQWLAAGSFTQPLTVTSTGPFAGNQSSTGTQPPEHQAIVDYFFNSLSPITPEDGQTIGVAVNVQGQGTVTRQPDQPSYVCGETVTLTANPAAGWNFSGWSGALTGTEPSQDITIVGPMSVTATFVPQNGLGFRTYLPSVLR